MLSALVKRASATLIALTILAGCVSQTVQSTTVPPAAAAGADYVLGPGDKIRLSLYGDDTFKGEFQVSDNGTVSLPLIGAQMAGGKSIDQFSADVEAALANGFYNEPRLSAEVLNFRPFYILGEVKNPGEYPYVADLTLARAVAIAGGYTYRADQTVVSLQRSYADEPLRVPASAGLELGPGDTIQVLERYF